MAVPCTCFSCHAGATNPDGVTPRHYGWWMGDDATILGANTVWILVIFGWTMGMMLPFFYGLKLCGWLRVSAEEELVRGSCHSCGACRGREVVGGAPASWLAACDACRGRELGRTPASCCIAVSCCPVDMLLPPLVGTTG